MADGAMEIRATRTVRVYSDRSELLYLIKEKCYVWQRPKPSGKGYDDLALGAANDQQALDEVCNIANAEHMQQMMGGI